MSDELFYQLALTQVPNVGCVQARILIQYLGNAAAVFKTPAAQLEKMEGIGTIRARSIRHFNEFTRIEKELDFIQKQKIGTLFLSDAAYPKRLLQCFDAPTLLFYKGTSDLNAQKTIAIVGTRNYTDYGKHFTEKLLEEISGPGLLIISGLALGIDAFAHKAAIRNSIPTVGVVGHGLDKIYPHLNQSLAREMIDNQGGILTEYMSGTKPDRHHFPLRNRIVAGLCDATVVIETGEKGGSMITANLADSYNRDVFALPGRVSDPKSSGCNLLIRENKATLLSSGNELLEIMGWKQQPQPVKKQRALFLEFTDAEKKVLEILQNRESVQLDDINLQTDLSTSTIAEALLNLELNGIIQCLPGKSYRLI